MIDNTIKRPDITPSEICEREVLRYAGCRGEAPEQTRALMHSVISELESEIKPSVLYRVYPLSADKEGVIDLGFARVASLSLAKHFRECTQVCVMIVSVGIGVDRYISRYKNVSPSRAHMASALGTERVEAAADAFSSFISAEAAKMGMCTTGRFSPGYGDLPLSLQSDLIACLNAGKLMGIALSDSMLMTPTKTVSALIGLREGDK